VHQSQGPQHVIDKLVETVGKPRTDRYSASKSIGGESNL
jgi:alanine-synthesizing transaminase